jgi:hypothetical protein
MVPWPPKLHLSRLITKALLRNMAPPSRLSTCEHGYDARHHGCGGGRECCLAETSIAVCLM